MPTRPFAYRCPVTVEERTDACRSCVEFSHVSKAHGRPVCFEGRCVRTKAKNQIEFDRRIMSGDQDTMKEVFDAKRTFVQPSMAPSADGRADAMSVRNLVRGVLGTLTEREQEVIRLRFGLDDSYPRTLEEVASTVGVTRERVRQIEAKALRKLRHPFRIKRLREAFSPSVLRPEDPTDAVRRDRLHHLEEMLRWAEHDVASIMEDHEKWSRTCAEIRREIAALKRVTA